MEHKVLHFVAVTANSFTSLYVIFPSTVDLIERTNRPGKMFASGETSSRRIKLNVFLERRVLIYSCFAAFISMSVLLSSSCYRISVRNIKSSEGD